MFPAPAGINRDFLWWGMPAVCVPRASGDKPLITSLLLRYWWCSPRQRG
ncbi:hypothetical protein E8730_002688 [Escherichia coli]|nr:hypothetical protein [Escherichia coli]EEZ2686762.1 hypothetical protein [Escherichia coli]EFG1694441.1 hypothetical protein [Escherichia coli]EHX75675.1 hypothetical protein ECDEC14A_3004 [Escherichia coli DEC14A]